MAYEIDKKTGEIILSGFEQGIAPSPHKGIANIQNANISTETGEILPSFVRTKQNQNSLTSQTLTTTGSTGTNFTNSATLQAGQWINVSSVSGATYTPTSTTGISALVVGGGAAGGGTLTTNNREGGGGGAGQVLPLSGLTVAVSSYAITIGAGGTGVSGANGNNGASSSFASFGTATGGGGGGSNAATGSSGASGGGGGNNQTGGAATAGNAGGTGAAVVAGGGGGGAGAVGGNGVDNGGGSGTGGAGGNGIASSITGASVTYGGGGGGAAGGSSLFGAGGTGGGGAGGSSGGTPAGTAGTANTGGGGGGTYGATAPSTGAAGGSGIVVISYPTGQLTATGGTITTSGGNTIHKFTSTGTFQVTAIADVALPTGPYFVDYYNGTQIKLSFFYDPTGASPISYTHSGTLTYTTSPNIGQPVAKAKEKYSNSLGAQYRYYILDSQGLVWVYDTGLFASTFISNGVGIQWFLPDRSTTYFTGTVPSGIGVIDGWLFVIAGNIIKCKETVNLGDTTSNTTTYRTMRFTTAAGSDDAYLMSQANTTNPHFVLVGHQGRLYYTDGDFIGEIFPNSSLLTGSANVQSYASYTAATTVGTLNQVIGGSVPFIDGNSRLPVVFFPSTGGAIASALTADTVFWIGDYSGETSTFRVYAAATGGSPLDIQSGSTGTQYFNTFFPVGDDASAGGTHATTLFTPQRVNLPTFETSQSLVEIGNTVIIGCQGSTLYPWDEIQSVPSGIIPLPESNTTTMITVNQMAYVFVGNKGNIYITDGSVASAVTTVPDYVAGVPGTPSSYIEPYFSWGDAAYIRGRVYFSILDQTATKAGNCGGIWSFVPTQNLYIGQDVGIALRLENQNSYGTYNGLATVLLSNENQQAIAPQYWTGWYSSIATPAYGIDYTGNGASSASVVVLESDAIPTGTMLDKHTFEQIECKFASPLLAGDAVAINYRNDLTSAWKSVGTVRIEPTQKLSVYVPASFEKTQWLQTQTILTPGSASGFIRMTEQRIR